MPMIDPILITGAARSGTSLVANIIHHAGAKGGDVSVNPIPGEQPTGFYENEELTTRVSKSILFDLGFDPRGVKKIPDHNVPTFDVSVQVFNIARKQGITVGDVWYLKIIKGLLLYRTYLRSFPNSQWVLVRREPDGIIQSCMLASFMVGRETANEWADYVRHYTRMMIRLKRECPQVREVWYEKLLAGEHDEIESVLGWLGLDYDKEYIDKTVIKK